MRGSSIPHNSSGYRSGSGHNVGCGSIKSTTSRAIAGGSRHGTRTPHPSARISRAYRYGVEMTAFPAPTAYGSVPARNLRGVHVRRGVDVGGREEFDQLLLADGPIAEGDGLGDAQGPGPV